MEELYERFDSPHIFVKFQFLLLLHFITFKMRPLLSAWLTLLKWILQGGGVFLLLWSHSPPSRRDIKSKRITFWEGKFDATSASLSYKTTSESDKWVEVHFWIAQWSINRDSDNTVIAMRCTISQESQQINNETPTHFFIWIFFLYTRKVKMWKKKDFN